LAETKILFTYFYVDIRKVS